VSEPKQIVLLCDQADFDAIQDAIAQRQAIRCMPDSEAGNLAGATIAEICRGWMEMKTFDFDDDEEEWKNA
jgi:hypothetical protein